MKPSLILQGIACLAVAVSNAAASRLYSRNNPRPARRDVDLAPLKNSPFNMANTRNPAKIKNPWDPAREGGQKYDNLTMKCVWGSGGTPNLKKRRKRGENKFVELRDTIKLGWADGKLSPLPMPASP